ncbi:MAG: AsnC family transcriptional regulator [Gemmatimonadota bacterium]|nr:MAG: AsnC family transcriptional regulator [Gemmatimonadota bacterium]
MQRPLDRIDRVILAELQKDARQSNKELAAKAGLAPSSCLERVRQLRAGGVLRGFHADVDPAALGIGIQAIIAVRILQHTRKMNDAFRAHVIALPEVIAAQHLAGENDYLLHVAVRDVQHLRNLTLDELTTREEVGHVETALIFDHHRSWTLPDYSGT